MCVGLEESPGFAGILLYTRIEGGGGTSVGYSYMRVYFYIPMMVGVFLVVLREACVAAVFIFIILYAMSL